MGNPDMVRNCEHHARRAALEALNKDLDPNIAGLWFVAVGLKMILREHLGTDPLLEYQLAGEALSHTVKILMQRNLDVASATMTDEQFAQFKDATNAIMRQGGLVATQ